MDPYLEDPLIWPDVHNSLIVYLRAEIQKQLPPGFSARLDERVFVEETRQQFLPDVVMTANAPSRPQGGVALLERPVSPLLEWIEDEGLEIREPFIEIHSLRGERRVVSVIEVLSVANKSRGRGREAYLRKQNQVLSSETHLLELDLLRRGEHTVVLSKAALWERFGRFDYCVALHRAGLGTRFQALAWTIADPLPTVPVPLDDSHRDIEINLQAVFSRVYDEGGFASDTDYSVPYLQETSLPTP